MFECFLLETEELSSSSDSYDPEEELKDLLLLLEYEDLDSETSSITEYYPNGLGDFISGKEFFSLPFLAKNCSSSSIV